MENTFKLVLLGMVLVLGTASNVVYLNPGCKSYDDDGHCYECSSRFYQDSQGICQPVSPHCNDYDHYNGSCITCYSGYTIIEDACLPEIFFSKFDPLCNKFQGSKCIRCSQGCYFNDEGKCVQGDPNCKSYRNNLCSECYSGYQLKNYQCKLASPEDRDPNCNIFEEGVCVKCSYGYYFNSQKICQKIPDECKDFRLEEKRCYQCYFGYVLNEDNKCIKESRQILSDPNCNQFRDGECTKCSFGYYFNDLHICTKIPDECKDFSIEDRRCYECYYGYSLDENNHCIKSEEELVEEHCNRYEYGKCVLCSSGYYFNEHHICTKIPDECKTFNLEKKICEECYLGYQLTSEYTCEKGKNEVEDAYCNQFVDGVCTKCSKGYFFNQDRICIKAPDECKRYDTQYHKCYSCYDGYILSEHNECLVDREGALSDPNCNEFVDGVCNRCSYGYYFNNKHKCINIPPECKLFHTAEEICEECYDGYQIKDYKCVLTPKSITQKYCKRFQDKKCVECASLSILTQENLCKLVNPLCKTYNKYNGDCQSCFLGFQVKNGECVEGEQSQSDPYCKQFEDGKCVQCSQRYFMDRYGKCSSVDPLCKTYNPTNGECRSCFDGFKLDSYRCVVDSQALDDSNCARWVDGECVECSQGAFLNYDKKCELVSNDCRSYDHYNGDCLSCYEGYQLKGGKCVEDDKDKHCRQFEGDLCVECWKGYYLNIQSICQKINYNCKEFNIDKGQCQSCYTGYKLVDGFCEIDQSDVTDYNCAQFKDGKCQKCSSGYYFDSQHRCIAANPLCKEFNPYNGNCTDCFTGFELKEGECVIGEERQLDPYCAEWLGQICTKCADRAVFNEYGHCIPVDKECKTYNKYDGTCQSCFYGYEVIEGSCVKSQSSSTCLEHDEEGHCSKCIYKYYLDGGQCKKVDDQCAQFNYEEKQCQGCYPGYSLLYGNCEITKVDEDKKIKNCYAYTADNNCLQCFDRYYLAQLNVCRQVDVLCKSYDKKNGECTGCYEGFGFVLVDGKCEK